MSEIKINHQEILDELNAIQANIKEFEYMLDNYIMYLDIFNEMESSQFIPVVIQTIADIKTQLQSKTTSEIKQLMNTLETASTLVKEMDETIGNEFENEKF